MNIFITNLIWSNIALNVLVQYMLITTVVWFFIEIVVLFRMPKSKEVLSSSSDSDSDSEVDTKVWKRITQYYTFNYHYHITLSNSQYSHIRSNLYAWYAENSSNWAVCIPEY